MKVTGYKFGPFHLNTVDRCLFRGGGLVPLPQKVFEVLLVLVEQRGKIVDKEAFFQTDLLAFSSTQRLRITPTP